VIVTSHAAIMIPFFDFRVFEPRDYGTGDGASALPTLTVITPALSNFARRRFSGERPGLEPGAERPRKYTRTTAANPTQIGRASGKHLPESANIPRLRPLGVSSQTWAVSSERPFFVGARGIKKAAYVCSR
jgi:hypothetical protein